MELRQIYLQWRVLLAWLLVFLAGMAGLTGHVPASQSAGALCALLGAGGCAWEVMQWVRGWRVQQQAARQASLRAERQAAQKITRQARQQEQQTLRQLQKSTQAQARQAQEQRALAEREAQVERATQEAAQRSARFAQVSHEADRLQTLDAAAFRAEAERIFAIRGLMLQHEAEPNTILRLLRPSDGSLEIARFVESETAVADVEALEMARQQADAVRAYLIGRSRFTPAAIRLAQRFPLTFVEPQLLAQWKLSAKTE